jgi:hypothetical protein
VSSKKAPVYEHLEIRLYQVKCWQKEKWGKVLQILSNFGESCMVEIGRYFIDKTRKSDRLSSVRIAETFPINILIREIVIIRWNFAIFLNIAF